MIIEFLEPAQAELDDTFEYYEMQHKSLGYKFINEIQHAIELIKFYPLGWHQISQNTRRCLLKTFPYGIIYRARNNHILIVAIANLHRKPNYWKKRMK